MKKKCRFIPLLTTEAGRCLTELNWQETGVNRVAIDLPSLLMKPGLEFLTTLPDLAVYTGWHGEVVLNAAMPKPDKEDGYTLRSEYDGSRRRYTKDDILLLIAQIKPQLVLLPEGMHQGWQSLPNTIVPFFPHDDLPVHADRTYGVYFTYDTATSFSTLVQQIQKHQGFSCCVSGELSLEVMQKLADLGVQYLVTDAPARDACEGRVYTKEGVFSLKDDTQRLNFNGIDELCDCPTCEQQLTRAYLHHLLEHTPLLCQRFLIQHNVMWAATSSWH